MKIPVLMYHKVSPGKGEKYRIGPERFARQIGYLFKKGYETISPDELLGFIKGTRDNEGRGTRDEGRVRPLSVIRVRRGTLPQRPLLITFDDGYKDNFSYACPVLERYNFRATIFLVTRYMGQKNGWSKAGGGEEEMLSWEEIAEMRKRGFSFGSHTHTHPNLLELPRDRLLSEIRDSKRILEERLGEVIGFFAYPYGKFNTPSTKMVKEAGYRGAFSTLPGKNGVDEDPFLLRRILIRGYDSKLHFILNLKLGKSRI